MVTLNVNLEDICTIILKAREFHAKEGVVIPEVPGEMSEEQLLEVLADHQHDLTYQEIKLAINDLEPDQKATLVSLMYLGRGDYEVNEWEDAMEFSSQNLTQHTAEYLLGKPHVADFLEEGLNILGYTCNE